LAQSSEQQALSIRQLWLFVIVNLGKDVENRSMRTHRHGRILIRAALKVEREETKRRLDPDEFPTAATIGSLEIVYSVRNAKSKMGESWPMALDSQESARSSQADSIQGSPRIRSCSRSNPKVRAVRR
jgi:hypothetical protein